MTRIKYLQILLVFLFILFLIPSASWAGEATGPREVKGWEYTWGDLPANDTPAIWKNIATLTPGKFPSGATAIWFRVKLEGNGWTNPAIYIPLIYAKTLSIYTEQEKIYEVTHRTFYNTHILILPLPRDFNGQRLYLRINQPELRELALGQVPKVFIGDFRALFYQFLKENMFDLILGCFFILLAVAFFLGSLFLKIQQKKSWVSLSLILFCFGILWALFPNNVGTFFPPLEEKLLFLLIIALAALPVLLIYFFEQIFGPGYKSYLRRLWQIQLVFSLLCLGTSLVNILSQYRFNELDYLVSNVLMSVIYLVIFMILVVTAIYYAVKKNIDARIFTAGFSALAVLLILDVLIFLFISNDHSFILLKCGVILQVLSLICIMGRRVALNYDQVIKYSKELEIKNRVLDSTWKEIKVSRDQLLELNKTLEQRVSERTEQLSLANSDLQQVNEKLSISNHDLIATLDTLTKTQNQLIESEKMAALGQLVAGVAHEINSPLGALYASIENMLELLNRTLQSPAPFYQTLSAEDLTKLQVLLQVSFQNNIMYHTASEERDYRKAWLAHLQTKSLPNPEKYADMLVTLGIYAIEPKLSFLENPASFPVLEIAYQLTGLLRNVNIMKIAVEKTSKVVFALKSYAHFSSSSELTVMEVQNGVETVLTLYQNKIKLGVEVIRNYADIKPIRCYPDELNQIWTNIIHNALQAMDYQGKLQIDISQTGRYVMVAFTDSGTGIPEAIKDKIFEPFFTTKPQGEGSGLGLHIVKQIVEKHRGKIEFDSQPGRTIFRVFIPDDL